MERNIYKKFTYKKCGNKKFISWKYKNKKLLGTQGAQGAQGIQGIQGPALFTLENTLNPVYSLTSNSIITNNNNESIVSTVENYYTAFITCIVNSGSCSLGFTSINYPNTISFNFQINPSDTNTTTCSIGYNGSGNVGSYDYTYGQVLTIALTSINCKFFINGILIYTSNTDVNYLNVRGWFYISNSCNISNIAYGYLNDPVVG